MSDARPPTTPRKRSETRQRTTLVALRLHPDEHQTLTDAAQARRISLSELLRSSALKAVESERTGSGQV